MKALLASLLALLLIPPAAGAAGLADYRETLTLAPDGSAAVHLSATLSDATGADVALPFGHASARALAATANGVAVPAELVHQGALTRLVLHLPQPPAGSVALAASFTAEKFLDWQKARSPRGGIAIGYAFLDTSPLRIADFQARLVLPEGYIMNGITRSLPAATGEEVVPPYTFATEAGRLTVDLRAPSLAPGQGASIAFGVRPAGRAAWPAVAGALAVALAGLWVKWRAAPSARATG